MPEKLQRSDAELLSRFQDLSGARSVADLLEVKHSDLTWFLYRRDLSTNYTTFLIKKRSGGIREISAPVSSLKILQRKLSHILQLVYEVRRPVHGFARRRSIVSNARPHVGKSLVLNIDLEGFFPSINFGRVRGMLMAPPYEVPERAATVIAHMCCYENTLPQGAPTSPVVSNMVCGKLDSELSRLARRNRCVYTRYADDITFSPWNDVPRFSRALADLEYVDGKIDVRLGDGLEETISACGFKVNKGKVRLMRATRSQVVTGLQVNERLNVRQSWLRELRGLLHAWEKHGLDAAQKPFLERYCRKRVNSRLGDDYGPSLVHVVAGKLAFLRNVRGERDRRYRWLCNWYDRLRGVGMRYQYVPCLQPTDAVWVVEVEGTNSAGTMVCEQGTAFYLMDVGLITCYHVVDGMDKIEVLRPDSSARYPAKVTRRDSRRDLALLSADVPPSPALDLGTDTKQGSPVRVVGFPDYAPGTQAASLSASVADERTELSVRKIRLDRSIIYGMSGGPVLGNDDRVTGITERGAADPGSGDSTGRHNAVSVSELQDALGEWAI